MKRPTYTPASYIKKVFRLGERSLPKDEIIDRLNQWLEQIGEPTTSERVLNETLSLPESPVRVGSSEAIIELTYQPHQLFDLAYRYVRESHAPKSMEQILREVRRQTTFSWNQAARLLILEKDPRFVQYAGDSRWYLAEWQVMNDQVYTWMVKTAIDRTALRNVPIMAEQELGLAFKEHIFVPEQDDRFVVSGENLYLNADLKQSVEQVQDQEKDTLIDPETIFEEVQVATVVHSEVDALQEIAAAMTVVELETESMTTKEESDMNMTQQQVNASVKQEVSQHLRQALAILEARNHQMSQEVINHFQESNIQAIEVLMKEKHKNEQTVVGLGQVLAQFEQQ
ncbi:hypothetical protein ACQCN2_07245 [Brevibacillus ginsengisoli]|uniref:hypothetical protein n=1 Tax=Brevibacillus ginsengisoli TaxID=363854 RepID=UPI003CE7126D